MVISYSQISLFLRLRRFIAAGSAVVMVFSFSITAKTSVAIFPFSNTPSESLFTWTGAACVEAFSRNLQVGALLHVWEPLFFCEVDSAYSSSTFYSDSLLKAHQARWMWDVGLCGNWSIHNDSLFVRFRLIQVKNRIAQKDSFDRSAPLKQINRLIGESIEKFCTMIDYDRSHDIVGLSIPAVASNNPEALATAARGYLYEIDHSFTKALSAYLRAAELDPSSAVIVCRIAMLYAQSGLIDEAQRYFDKALIMAPSDPWVVQAVGNFIADNQPPDKAFAFCALYRNQLSKTSRGALVLAKISLVNGEYQRASAAFNRLLAGGMPDFETNILLAKAYSGAGQYDQAIEVINQIISLCPGNIRYYSLLGSIYRDANRLSESFRVLENSLALAPDRVDLYVNLSHTCVALGWYVRSESLLRRALDLSPGNSELLINMAVTNWFMGKVRACDSLLDIAASIAGTRQAAFANKANVLLLSGHPDKAVGLYKKASKVDSQNPSIWYNLGVAYEKMGKLTDASACFSEVLFLTPDRIDVLREHARISLLLHFDMEAESNYGKILDLSPGDRSALIALTGLLVSQERFEEAIALMESYLQSTPGDHDIMLKLADAYRSRGWLEVAREHYQRIVNLFARDGAGYYGLGRTVYELALKNKEDFDRAIYYLKSAVSFNPSNPEPEILIGRIYYENKQGYASRAIEYWEQALTRTKNIEIKNKIQLMIAEARK